MNIHFLKRTVFEMCVFARIFPQAFPDTFNGFIYIKPYLLYYLLSYLLTYSTEHIPSCEANRFSFSQEIPRIL